MPKKSLHLSERAVELLERYAAEHGLTQSQTVERAISALVEEPAGNQPGACGEPSRSQAGASLEPLWSQLAAKDEQIAGLTAALRSMADAERARAVSEVALVPVQANAESLGFFEYLRSRFSRRNKHASS